MTDQHRFDCLGYAGHPLVETPRLDELAGESVQFENAYTPSPVCGPARASLFTGRFPSGCGVTGNWDPLAEGCQLLPERLRDEAGYRTSLVGKLHFTPAEQSFGFERKQLHDAPYNVHANCADHSAYTDYLRTVYGERADAIVKQFDDDESQYPDGDLDRFVLGTTDLPEEHHMTQWTADHTVREIQAHDPDERPLFMFASFFGPHHPWLPPSPWREMYDPADVTLPPQFDEKMAGRPVFDKVLRGMCEKMHKRWSTDRYRELTAAYLGSVSMLDHHIGRILDAVREKSMWDDTLIVFTADHGEHLGQYGALFKSTMYESSARVPLLVKSPGPSHKPRPCNRVVSTLDLYATLLKAAGLQAEADPFTESHDLSSCLSRGHSKGSNENNGGGSCYSIIGRDPDQRLAMLRDGPMKLIRLAQGQALALYELYDLNDPVADVRDVWDDLNYANVRHAMQQRLDAWCSIQTRSPMPMDTA